jgi:hypothetical protein
MDPLTVTSSVIVPRHQTLITPNRVSSATADALTVKTAPSAVLLDRLIDQRLPGVPSFLSP